MQKNQLSWITRDEHMKNEMAAKATILDAKSIAQIKFYNSQAKHNERSEGILLACLKKKENMERSIHEKT